MTRPSCFRRALTGGFRAAPALSEGAKALRRFAESRSAGNRSAGNRFAGNRSAAALLFGPIAAALLLTGCAILPPSSPLKKHSSSMMKTKERNENTAAKTSLTKQKKKRRKRKSDSPSLKTTKAAPAESHALPQSDPAAAKAATARNVREGMIPTGGDLTKGAFAEAAAEGGVSSLAAARLFALSRQAESAGGPAAARDRERALKKGRALLKRLSGRELHELLKHRKTLGLFHGEAAFQAGKRAWKTGRFKKARRYFKKARAQLPPGAERSKAEIYLKTARLTVNPYLTGVILPLSGRRAVVGEKALKGIRLGLGLQEGSPWRIAVIDSGSRPERARQAVRDLLFESKALSIIGGLSGRTATVIAETAEAYGVPALLLSQKQSLTKDRLFVFQSALSGKALMKRLASGLIDDFNITKAAMLIPKDNYGKSYARLFEEAFQAAGGAVVSRADYAPGETDFKDPVKKLVKLFDLKERREEYEKLKAEFLEKNPDISERRVKLTPERLLKPETDFQVLFIPDSLKIVRRIVSYLKYFDIKDIHLAGTNLWKTSGDAALVSRKAAAPDLPADGAAAEGLTAGAKASPKGPAKDAAASGAKAGEGREEDFPLVFAAEEAPSNLAQSPFYLKFQKVFQAEPGFFEIQGYNTAAGLRAALKTRPKNRFQLQKALESVKNFEGAFFPLKIRKDRSFARPIKFYRATRRTNGFSLRE